LSPNFNCNEVREVIKKKTTFISAHTTDIDITDVRQIPVAGVPLAAALSKAFLPSQTQSSSYNG
jgi:hypothetical protein